MSFPFGLNRRRNEHSFRESKVLVEPLEPRLLLAADFALNLADLGGLADEPLTIEVFRDQGNAALRLLNSSGAQITQEVFTSAGHRTATPDLSQIARLEIIGRTADDRITIDATSFIEASGMAANLPVFFFDGNGGTNTLSVLVGSAGSGPVTMTGDWAVDRLSAGGAGGIVTASLLDGGAAAGGIRVEFAAVERLVGGLGDDTFRLLDGAIDGAIGNGGRLAVDGGDGSFDSLVFEGGNFSTLRSVADDAHSGTITIDAATIRYDGLEPITFGGTIDNLILETSAFNDVATLRAEAAGFMVLESTGVGAPTFEQQIFANPTESLTIQLGNGDDALFIAGLDGGWTADLTIVGGDGADTVTISADIATGGGSVEIQSEFVAIADGVSVSTVAANGVDAGDFIVHAKQTQIRDLADILAPAPLETGITVGAGASIDAGGIFLLADSLDLSLQATLGLPNLENNYFQRVNPIPQLTTLATLPVKVLTKSSRAVITVADGASLNARGGLGLVATANSIGEGGAESPLFSIAYVQTSAEARVDIGNSVNISASGALAITAGGESSATITAKTARDLGDMPTDPNKQIALAFAASNAILISRVTVGAGSVIESGRTANVAAEGSVTSSAEAESGLFAGGQAGLAFALDFSKADVSAEMNGTLIAGMAPGSVVKIEFDPEAAPGQRGHIDYDLNRILVGDIALETEDTVDYTASRGMSLYREVNGSPLTMDGKTFFIIRLEDDAATPGIDESHYIRLAATLADAIAGKAIELVPLGVEPAQTSNKGFAAADVDAGADTIALANPAGGGVLFGNTFKLGQAVIYEEAPGAPISGLVDGATYYVITGTNQFNLEGDLRFVDTQVIRLARTENEAMAGVAIDIEAPPPGASGYMLRAAHILDSGLTTGAGVKAGLEASTSASAKAGLSSVELPLEPQSADPPGFDPSSSLFNNLFATLRTLQRCPSGRH